MDEPLPPGFEPAPGAPAAPTPLAPPASAPPPPTAPPATAPPSPAVPPAAGRGRPPTGVPLSNVSATSAEPLDESLATEPPVDDQWVDAPPPARGYRWLLPSQTGALGLFETSTADVGPVGHLRLGLQGRYFRADGVLVSVQRNGKETPDTDSRLQGQLTFGLTLHPDFELFGALYTSSNRNERVRDPSDRDPEIIKAFGDFVIGGKYRLFDRGGLGLSLETGFKFMSAVTGLSISPDATSWWFGPVATYDLEQANQIPLRFHANANFYWDRSDNLPDWKGVPRQSKEVALFAYGIAESRFRFAFAVDAPLARYLPQFPLLPFMEYHLEVVTTDADPTFADYMSPMCPTEKHPCKENRDMQWLTLGVRADVYEGLTAELGVDLRIRSVGFPYGPPLAPFNVIFGLAYPFDIASFRRPRVVTRTIARVVKEPAVVTQLQGTVRSKRDGAPVPDAVVTVTGSRTRYLTEADGVFEIAGLPPGPCTVEVKAKGFDPANAQVSLTSGRKAQIELHLTPHPEVASVHGKVTGPSGGVAATLRFTGGPEPLEIRTAVDGSFGATLPPGHYDVRVEASGLAVYQTVTDLVAGQDPSLDVALHADRPHPEITFQNGVIKLKTNISFPPGVTALTPGGRKALDGLAEVLEDRPAIGKVRIEAHTDSALPKDKAIELTTAQAEAIRAYLVKKGINAARLEAVGVGGERPLVPNLGPANRAKNRRVELHYE